ncbi:hypothetical protein [Phascolarctobacterium succinatutens]|jgi:hypothetical protein|uniref:hypothetical protein n=1 Tax=Phascolarctobacterium succinatutens TaxID=626940 RepID=UPI003F7D756B
MEFITLDNITDSILLVTQEDVDEANAYLESIAARYGVTTIQQPISHSVKRLGIAYACYMRAVASVGTDASVTFDGSRHDDVFVQKAELYGKEVKMLAATINANDFTGTGCASRFTIKLMRG